jgi:hypothetical protein
MYDLQSVENTTDNFRFDVFYSRMSSAILYHCHGLHILFFVNYQNFGDNKMTVTSKSVIKTLEPT